MKSFLFSLEELRQTGVPIPCNLTYSSAFVRFQKLHYNIETSYGVFFDGDTLLCALPINIHEGKAFSAYKEYTQPYCREGYEAPLAQLVKSAGKVSYAKVTILTQQPFPSLSPARMSIFERTLMPVDTRESLLASFKQETRTAVRKSYKAGFEIRIAPLALLLNEFYPCYVDSMARLHATPKTREYFEHLAEAWGTSCVCMAAYKENELAGAHVIQTMHGYARMTYTVSYPKFWKERVNNFLYMELLLWAQSNAFSTLDLGPGVDSDMKHNSFKEGFGAVARPLYTGWSGSPFVFMRQWLSQKHAGALGKFRRVWNSQKKKKST